MNEGQRVLVWIQENGHTVSAVAEKIGYSRQSLSRSLHGDTVSPQLAEALYEHFWLRVTPTEKESDDAGDVGRPARRGRPHGRPTTPSTSKSKLDAAATQIAQRLEAGATQREIAKSYGTAESTLHEWLKRHGLLRNRHER